MKAVLVWQRNNCCTDAGVSTRCGVAAAPSDKWMARKKVDTVQHAARITHATWLST